MDELSSAAEGPQPPVNQQVVLAGPGDVRLEAVPVPAPNASEVVVRTRASLISTGTELAHLLGPPWRNPDGRQLPVYPSRTGYSNAGVIEAVGETAGPWRPGERVASEAPHAAYARRTRGQWLVRIPDTVSDQEAAFCTVATIVLHGCRLGVPQLGEDAVVLGMGLLGQLLVQYLRLAGCRTVVGIDVSPDRLRLAERIGAATHLLDAGRVAPVAEVERLTGGRGADVVYEATGRTASFDQAFALARVQGRVVALGSPRQPAPVDMQQLHMKALHVVGAIVSSHPAEGNPANRWSRIANAELALSLMAVRRLNVRDLITDRYPAEDAPRAYAALAAARERHLGVILEW